MKTNLLFLLAALLFTCNNTYAYDAKIDGIYYNFYGDNAEVTYITKTNYFYFSDYSGDVVIPVSVTYGSKTYSVTSIGFGAFYGCSSLTSVIIPNSVTSIGYDTFRLCDGLTSVTLPKSVTNIGSSAFRYCSSLTSITIPDNITSIENDAFNGCSGLTSITIPESVTSIGEYAFYDCSCLTSIICLAENVPETGELVFGDVPQSDATLYVPKSSLNAYKAADQWKEFGEIKELPVINFADDNVKALCVANWDTDGDGELNVGEAAAVTSLGVVFKDNTTITSFDELQYFTGLTTIGENAFDGCTHLKSITIPESVTSIGWNAFSWCSRLISVTLNSNEIVSKQYDPYNDEGIRNIFGVGVQEYIIGNSVMSIGNYAFSECYDLTSVTIGSGVTSIGPSAFSDCKKLTSVTIGSGVTSIGYGAFSGCKKLTSVTIPNNVTNIGHYAFGSCSGLTSVTIPNNVTSIGDGTFSGCSGLTSVVVAAGNTKYDSRNNCNAIIETASNTLIAGCKNTIIPNSVTSIGENAFSGCSGLTSVTIPNSVTSIGYSAFSGCSGLTSINIPNSVTSIGNSAFNGCDGLTSINIPNSVTSIGDYAFYGCFGLTSVICLAENVPATGSSVFYDVPQSTVILYVPEISVNAYKTAKQWREFGNIVGIDPTAVEELKSKKTLKANENAPIYDLMGRRLQQKPASGYYIQGGKKFFVK